MEKIVEYRIIKGQDTWLSGRITKLLSEGWKLYGYPYSESDSHCQAVVKYGEDSIKEILKD